MHDLALVMAALLLGAAGTPHCLAMCSLACDAACRKASPTAAPTLAFHLARVAGYAAAGAVFASGVAMLGSLAGWSSALRPLWTLAHVAALMLGLWMLWRGTALVGLPWASASTVQTVMLPMPHLKPAMTSSAIQAMRPGLLGLAWVAMPCGLLQTALLIASLANSAHGGALVMAGFATVTGAGMVAAGPLLRQWGQRLGPRWQSMPVRLAGLVVASAASWSLLQAAVKAGYCQI